ncbi:MAG: S6e family ribosomal protein [Candidatus Njordarchaeia archaeon]
MPKEVPIQIVINDKETGVTTKFEFEDLELRKVFHGKKIGETIDGELIGLPGYVFQIRGASDIAGFPHLKGIPGVALKKILKSGPPGYRPRKIKKEKKTGGYRIINLKNVKKKKSVRGEELSEWTRQVNMVIVERKGKKIEELDENAIVNDKLLVEIAEKVGKVTLRPCFNLVKVGSDKTLGEYLADSGVDEGTFKNLYRKVGITVLKLGDRKKEILKQTRYASRKHIDILSSHIIALAIDYFNKFKKGEVDFNSEEFLSEFSDKIKDIMEKYLNGELKERAKIKLTLEE